MVATRKGRIIAFQAIILIYYISVPMMSFFFSCLFRSVSFSAIDFHFRYFCPVNYFGIRSSLADWLYIGLTEKKTHFELCSCGYGV